jgi:hypothetical protein
MSWNASASVDPGNGLTLAGTHDAETIDTAGLDGLGTSAQQSLVDRPPDGCADGPPYDSRGKAKNSTTE